MRLDWQVMARQNLPCHIKADQKGFCVYQQGRCTSVRLHVDSAPILQKRHKHVSDTPVTCQVPTSEIQKSTSDSGSVFLLQAQNTISGSETAGTASHMLCLPCPRPGSTFRNEILLLRPACHCTHCMVRSLQMSGVVFVAWVLISIYLLTRRLRHGLRRLRNNELKLFTLSYGEVRCDRAWTGACWKVTRLKSAAVGYSQV